MQNNKFNKMNLDDSRILNYDEEYPEDDGGQFHEEPYFTEQNEEELPNDVLFDIEFNNQNQLIHVHDNSNEQHDSIFDPIDFTIPSEDSIFQQQDISIPNEKMHTHQTFPHYLEAFSKNAPINLIAPNEQLTYQNQNVIGNLGHYPIYSFSSPWWNYNQNNVLAEKRLLENKTFQIVWEWLLDYGLPSRMKPLRDLGSYLLQIGNSETVLYKIDVDFKHLIALFYYFFAELFYDVNNIGEIQDIQINSFSPLEAGSRAMGGYWKRNTTVFNFAINFFNWMDNRDTQNIINGATQGIQQFNWQQIFSNRLVSMDLYHLFLLFYHKMVMFSQMLEDKRTNFSRFPTTNVFNQFGLDDVHYNPYKYWFKIYIAWIQNLTPMLYKQIIKTTFNVKQAHGRFVATLHVPKEMGNLVYWNVNSIGGRLTYFNPLTKNYTQTVFDKLYEEDRKAVNRNALEENFTEDQYGIQGQMQNENNNLAKLIGDFLIKLLSNYNENSQFQNIDYINIVYSYFSPIRLDAEARNNGGYWTANCSINIKDICFSLRDIHTRIIRSFNNNEKSEIIEQFYIVSMNFILHRLSIQIMEYLQRYAQEIDQEILESKTIKFGGLEEETIVFKEPKLWDNLIREISVIGIRYFGFLHLQNNNLVRSRELTFSMLQSFHGEKTCDLFIPSNTFNCILQCLFWIIRQQIDEEIEMEYFHMYLDYLLGGNKSLKLMNYISQGSIWECVKIYNSLNFSLKILIYVYNSNTLIFKEDYQINSEDTRILLLYQTKIGFISKEKYKRLSWFRINSKKWRIIPDVIEIKQENNCFSLWNMKTNREKICKKIRHDDGSIEKIYVDKKNKKKISKLKEKQDNIEIWGWDCETIIFNYDANSKKNKYDVYCIAFYEILNETVKTFWGLDTIADLIIWLNEMLSNNLQTPEQIKLNGKKKILLVSFNGARFDNLLLIDSLLIAFHNNIEIIGHPNNLKTIIIGKTLYFMDARLIYTQMNLKNLAKKILQLDKGDFDIMSVIKDRNLYEFHKEEIIKYCVQDAKLVGLLYQSVKKFVEKLFISENRLQDFYSFQWYQPTLSLLSVNIWKKLFPSNHHIVGAENWDIYNIEKSSYKGGMCIPIRKRFLKQTNDDYLHYYDINSSYPTSMKNYEIPIKFKRHCKDYNILRNKNSYLPYNLYLIRYKFKNNVKIPCLPMRVDFNSKQYGKLLGLIYLLSNEDSPQGDWVFGIEIIKNYELFEYIICHEHIEYEKGYIFADYITTLYDLRKKAKEENDEPNNFFLKLLMNSLYGKFGQRKFGKIDILDGNSIHEFINHNDLEMKDFIQTIKNITPYTPMEDNSFFLMEYYPDDNLNFIGGCVRISSYIAALSRTQLMEGIKNVGMESIYYFDTDSIFTNRKLDEKMIGDELGQWKCEYDDIIEAYFFNPKVYAFKRNNGSIIMKCKGIPQSQLKWEMFQELEENGKVVIENLSEIKHILTDLYLNEDLKKIITILDRKRKYKINGDSIPYNNLNEILLIN